MFRVWSTFVLAVVVAAFPLACSRSPDWEAAHHLDAMERSRVRREKLWGDAWQFPAGDDQIVEVGPIPENGLLRLSVLGDEEAPSAVRVRIYAGNVPIEKLATSGEQEWVTARVDLAEHGGIGTPCRLVFDCDAPFAVGVCELLGRVQAKPNVLLYLVDTLRLDHLGCYGYERNTSPHIDAFASDCVMFTQLMPQSSWTRPSVASLLTSTYPDTHGANDAYDRLRGHLPRLAASMAAAGYETHGLVTNPSCLPIWGIGGEFMFYLDIDSRKYQHRDDTDVTDRTIAAARFAAGRHWFF